MRMLQLLLRFWKKVMVLSTRCSKKCKLKRPQKETFVCNEEMTGENSSTYRGCQSRTISGKKCQYWNEQLPHKHTVTAQEYPDGGLMQNYCRNPSGNETIWCFTEDLNVASESCEPLVELKAPTGVVKSSCKEQDK